jgi:hypothetical protein
LPEHTGPLENDHQTPDPEEDGSVRNSNGRMGTITEVEGRTVGNQLNIVASTSSDTESQNSRPQSPNKKVHFPQNLLSLGQGSSRPESSTDAPKTGQGDQTNLNPTLRNKRFLTSAFAPDSSVDESTEESESSIPPAVIRAAIRGEQKDISEETREQNASQTAAAVPTREKNISRWRRFLCCSLIDD